MNISARRSSAKHVGLFFQLPGSRLLCALLVSLQVLLPSLAAALPIDGNVVAGQATIQQVSPTTLSIAQASDKAILNWNSFSIAANEAVHFIQPSVSSIALNRVIGVDPSVILGQLQANGRIFLINPNGILFGAGAQINVGGLLATTLQTRDEDFMAGRYLFAQDPLKGLKTVVNRGTIHVSDNGYVVLMAPGVSNEGVIVANLGTALLGSGQKFTLDLMGDGLIRYAINDKVLGHVTDPDGKPLSSAVSNSGTIQANGGQVILSARTSGDVFSSVVNQTGVIRAQSLVNHGGVVRLEGSDPVANAGTVGWQANLGNVQSAEGKVLNTGTIDVSAAEPGTAQGQVTITGEKVGVAGTILARGADGAQGGRVLISSTDKTVAASDSVIDTSGVGNSSAGNVVVWSDKNTMFGGTILAKGGTLGGNGGQIEVSGHENLGFFGQVNALAPRGTTGSLLLDPLNITVATGGAATLVQVDQFSDTPAVAQTIDPATINAAAANVTLQANTDITVTNPIAMTNNGVGITMQAGRDILVNAGVSTTNGNISLTANDSTAIGANRANATTGDIVFGAAGNFSAGAGNITLTINPSVAAPFNPGSITTVRNLTTTTGNISINSPSTVSLSGAVDAGSGTVAINANTSGGAGQNFTMNAGSSITTTNATAGAVQVNVNAGGGGTGTAALRSITTGNGGTLTVATNTGGNATGGDITQTAATLLDVGTGTINLTTPAIVGANIGAVATPILTTAGTITASTGTSGVFITESDGADATATATGAGAITLTSTTGALAIDGASSSGSGAITLAADTVNINAPLASTGALTINPVTAAGNLTVSSSSSSNLTDGFSSITIGNAAGTGVVTVNALTVSDPLTIRSPTTTGTVTVNGPIVGSGNGSVTLTGGTGATPITLNNGIATAGNAITLNDNVGLGADVTLDSTNGGGSPAGATINVTGTVNADVAANNRTLTLAGGTAGNVTLGGAVGGTQALQSLTVTSANALTMPAVTTSSDIQLNAENAVTLNGAVNAGSGAVTIAANKNGAGAESFTMAAGSSITTTNATAGAVQVNVNAGGGGTGTAALRSITTGNGGTLTVATNTGGNATGGDITQTAATLLDVGTGTINLTTSAIVGANIGAVATPILTTAGTITASTGTSGVFITESDGADATATATGAGAITLTSTTGALAIDGASSSGSGAITLAADTVNINAPLASTGALTINPVTAAGNLTVSSSSSSNLTDGFSSITIGNAAGTGVVTVNALTVSDPLTIRSPTTTGTVTVNGPIVGSGNGSVTLTGGTGATPITLNNGIATAGNAITLNDNVGLGADVTLDSTNGGGSPAGATINVTGTVNADVAANNRTLTLAGGTAGNVTLGGAVGGTQALQSLTVTSANALTMPAVTTSSDIQLNAENAVTLNGAVNAGSGAVTIAANKNGAGAESFTMAAGSSITTTNATAGAVQVNVNAGGGGTGTAALRSITTGNGGTLTVATNTGGNATGGDITQTAATLLDVGTGTINLTTPAIVGANIGAVATPILTTAGTITASTGTSGVFITESDGADATATATGAGAITLTSTTGALAIDGASSSGSGAITLAADTVNINAPLASTGALTINPVTAAGNLTVSSSSSSNLTDGFSSITIGNAAGTGVVTVNALTVSDPLTIRSPTTTGTVTVNGPIVGSGNGSVTLTGGTGATPITLNNGIATAGNAITLNDNVGLGADVTLDSTNGGGSPAGATINVTGTVNADVAANNRTLTLAGGTAGNVTLGGAVGGTQALQSLTVTSANALTMPAVTTSSDIQLNAENAVTLNGAVNAGSGAVTIAANKNGAGAESFTMAAGSSITTTNATAGAVQVNVNAGGGGTGTAALRSITTGNGGTLTVATNTGGNATGGDITQTAATLLDVGTGTINLTTSTAAGRNIGAAATNILTRTGTITATSGSNGIFLNNQTGVDLAGIQTTGPFTLAANGPVTGSGTVVVSGTTTLASGAGSSITLDSAGNNFGTIGITSGNNVVLRDANALNLGASTVSGTLNVTAGGLISQSGALAVAGNASFNTTAAPALGSVSLTNSGALTLATSTVGGNLTATAAGDITLPLGQTLTVAGDATLTPAGNVNLLGTTQVGGTQTLNGGTGSTFVLAADTNLNALALPAAGNITVNLTGTTGTFAGTPLLPAAVTLANAGNTFSGTVSVTTASPAFTGTMTNTYNLTQSAAVTLNPGQGLTATDLGGTAGTRGNITLPNAGNSFNTVTFTGGDIAWQQANAVTIGSVSANAGATSTGALTITANGSITQTGAVVAAGTTTLAAGAANDITLTNAVNDFSTVGITSGNNVTLTDANALTMNASTVSGSFSANAGNLTVGGAVASTGGILNLTGANTVTQLANLTANGANNVTVTTTTGSITMAAAATTTSGTGAISYSAGTDVTLGSLSTGGGVNVFANGGSVFSAAGSGTNVTAGANSTLQAFNGVVGTQAAPINVAVNPGTLGIRATTAIGGISAFLTGTVLPGNALTLLNVPPGLVCFNICTVASVPVLDLARSTFGYLNPETIIPAYYPQPSGSVLISDITSVYMPGTLLQPSPVSLSSGNPAVQSMGPKAQAGASCKQGETVPNQQAAAASLDIRCAMQ